MPRNRYLLLVVVVIAQALTILITWPLWQVREAPAHLPVWPMAQIPFGVLMLSSLVFILWSPREGLIAHAAVLVTACLFDQYRTQPQFFAVLVLIFAVVEDCGPVVCRWFLASLWCWAGIHKLVSPDWFGDVTRHMVMCLFLDPVDWHQVFCYAVGGGELAVGLVAIFRPRWAAVPCVLMHCGIVVFLMGFLRHNVSVVPWNLASAVVGAWVMWHVSPEWPRFGTARYDQVVIRSAEHLAILSLRHAVAAAWRPVAVVALLVYPAGFYLGWVDHGFAHVLYSRNYPQGFVTSPVSTDEIVGWEMAVPFPNERRLLRQYFERSAQPGDLLYVADPRALLPDQYFVLGGDRQAVEITREAWDEVQGTWNRSKPQFFSSVQGSEL